MKSLIHDIVTDLKFVLPCIAWADVITESEILVTAEVDLTRVYQTIPSVAGMTFVCDDYWGRATFKDENDLYYCSVDGALHFKGRDIEGEPHQRVEKEIQYSVPNIDSDISKFNPMFESAIEHFNKKPNLKLIKSEKKLDGDISDPDNCQIVCTFLLQIVE
jgi:hypothetical protein